MRLCTAHCAGIRGRIENTRIMRKAFGIFFTPSSSAAADDGNDEDSLSQPSLERSESSQNAREALIAALQTKGVLEATSDILLSSI